VAETNERFEQLLKAMVQGETPKASNEKRELEPDARTFRHKRATKDQ
jgi:hypothetical protein